MKACKRNTKKNLTLAVGFILLMPVNPTNADMQSELQSWMGANEYVNVNKPTAYESQAGGYGVSLGGLKYRTPEMQVGVFASARNAKISAGCGGIDMDLGGFNFVNKDQIVQQLRAIASNAKGMIFQMAIDTVSSMIGGNMKNFKNVADFMNQFQTNSCHAASEMMSKVTDVVSGDISRNQCISDVIDKNGLSYDQAVRECGPNGARVSVIGDKKNQNSNTWKAGNLAWAILMQDDYFKTNKESAILMMNITGTTIIRPSIANVETNSSDPNEMKDVKNYIQPWFITNADSGANCKSEDAKRGVGSVCYSKNVNRLFEILVNGIATSGSEIQVFRCANDNMDSNENGCPDIQRDSNGSAIYTPINIAATEAIKPKMVNVLNSIQIKMLQKDGTLTQEEKDFISDMDGAIYHYMLASTTLLRTANTTDSNLDAYLTLMAQRKVAERFASITGKIREAMVAGKLGADGTENKVLYMTNLEKTIIAFAGIANNAREAMIAMQEMQNMSNMYERALVSSMSSKMLSKVKFGG